MVKPLTRCLSASFLAAAIAAFWWPGAPVAGQSQNGSPTAYVAPRTPDGQPDLQGIWKAEGRAGYDLVDHHTTRGIIGGPGVVEGNEIPYQPWAAAKKAENFANRATADPLAKCYRAGVPRITYLDFPFQIVQSAKYVAILYEWSHVYRIIHTDDTPYWDGGIEFWMGDSRGRWEGNTLVVDVRNQNDQTWFDMAGDFHSADVHVVERYTRTGPDSIRYEATIEDPKVFTRPWKIALTLSRQHTARMFEYECEAEAEEARGDFSPKPTWYPTADNPATLKPSRPYADITRAVTRPTVTATIPRRADGKPDLSGDFGGTPAGPSWGIEDHEPRFGTPGGKSIIVDPPDRKLPALPWTRAEQQRRLQTEYAHEDPTAHCFVAGLPRSQYGGNDTMKVLPTADSVVIMYGRWSYRVVALDGRPHLPDTVRLWMGDSVGHWEGDTLVVDSRNLNGKSWLSEGSEVVTHAERTVERFTLVEPNRLEYEATIDDPIAYSRPWTIALTYRRLPPEAYLEEACLEGNQAFKLMKGAADKAGEGR